MQGTAGAGQFFPRLDENVAMLQQARRLIEADAMAAAAGRGSFQVDGKMIDIPVIERARKLLARHEAIERRMKR